jgi:hypothetical protein
MVTFFFELSGGVNAIIEGFKSVFGLFAPLDLDSGGSAGSGTVSRIVGFVVFFFSRVFRLFFTYIAPKEYDQWERFKSTQRLPQLLPLVHSKG